MNRRPAGHGPRRETGIVLFVALIVLIVMSLAGLALMRQTGSGTSIAGNVAFKEAATAVADVGVERARLYIVANSVGNTLWSDDLANGYYATWDPTFNPATKDWSTDAVTLPAEPKTRNTTSFVVHRLCAQTGAPGSVAGQQCAEAPIKASSSKGGGGGYGGGGDFLPDPQPFYRVTARVAGPRNTFSIVQVIVTF